MFYAHLPPIRLARFAVPAAAVLGLLTGCGLLPSRSQPSEPPPPDYEPQTALAPLDSSRSTAVGQAPPPRVLVNPRHPEQYVVQLGDTLWDISELFLLDAWYWPEIWQINPQVANPHLIYPGDILSLAYLVDGQPVIQIERGVAQRLSPRVRAERLEQAIPTIPAEMLRSFLSRPVVLSRSQLRRLPYVVYVADGLLGAAGEDVYVRGTDDAAGTVFDIVHLGERLVDPDNNRTLGYEGIYVGRGRVRRAGDPSTVFLTDSVRETRTGDYLLQIDDVAPANYFPRPPSDEIEGRIISVINGLSLIGQYQVVVPNRGARHGLEPGHVLRAFKTGERIDDEVKGALFTFKVRLPDEPAGTMMVFQTYERMSYALVMEATSEIRVLDTVRNP